MGFSRKALKDNIKWCKVSRIPLCIVEMTPSSITLFRITRKRCFENKLLQIPYFPVLASIDSYDQLIKKYKNRTEACPWILYETETNCGASNLLRGCNYVNPTSRDLRHYPLLHTHLS
ncbi:hypothetical protein F511_08068 [Dorcoceras hygrometricum]|uniref:Uncharacterized protein n=1 Tax=Dorcoceras hygrometricum TaxID=472368 RepID=A0A2Z7CU98_9LAMI|nr:hypothetical protein F511_08068 [Dorcoceras hygrometricum]